MYWLGDRTNKVWETWWNEHRKVTKIVKTCLSQPGHFPSTSTKIWQNYKAKSTYNQRHQWYKIMSEEKVRTLTPSTNFYWCWWQLKVPNSSLSCDFTDFKKWNENLIALNSWKKVKCYTLDVTMVWSICHILCHAPLTKTERYLASHQVKTVALLKHSPKLVTVTWYTEYLVYLSAGQLYTFTTLCVYF